MTAGCKVFGMALGNSSDISDDARSVFFVVSNPDVTKTKFILFKITRTIECAYTPYSDTQRGR